MNYWTQLSIDFANQRNYLDQLFSVYPTIPEGIRDIDQSRWLNVENAFNNRDNNALIKSLFQLDLFPIKDSYVAYLKRDPTAITRNPNTVARLCGRLYELGIDELFERCTEPKETNRQLGPLFNRWLSSGALGINPVDIDTFSSSTSNAVLGASDAEKATWCRLNLGYNREKGLDFVGRFNGKYILGLAERCPLQQCVLQDGRT